MNLPTQPYSDQVRRWPSSGQHILAHHDDESIVVYQAYRPATGRYAVEHGRFGDGFSYSRMSWIKPNFLWMMYRSGWGTKPGQEITLGLRLRREFFDEILSLAIPSTYNGRLYPTREDWQAALEDSPVRRQWDPDHDPSGDKVARRAIQLGLRGPILTRYGQEELLEVIDLTDFVSTQRENAAVAGFEALEVPVERVYVPGGDAESG